jgi:hypothetical protein
MAVTADSNLLGIYKVWYTDKSPEDVFFRNSPVVKMIPKTRIGGKQYNVPLLLGNGGNASGNLIVSTTNSTAIGSAPNVEFAITNGYLFSTFFVTNQEVQASMNVRGAYMPVAVNRMAQGLDSFRKLAATSLYGSGFGEIGQVGGTPTIASGANTVTFTDKTLVRKLSYGSRFSITNGALPSSTLRTGICTVTKLNGLSVTFTSDTAIGAVAATDWVELDGCRSGSTPLLPVGLTAWLPTIGNRTGGTWDTYIATVFFGVDRSVNVEGAAGQFILRNVGGSEKYADAIVRGVEAVRNAGGLPDMLVINSSLYNSIIQELNAQTTLWQSINAGGSINKNEVAKGISQMKYAFSTSWVDQVWDDPFCPTFLGYILEKDTLEMACLTNSETPIQDGIPENQPGKEALDSVKAPELNYNWLIDDYLTIQPGANTTTGPALQVIIQLYGQWVVHNPSKCCVINFVS